jgi:hypothetical protein
MDLYLKEVVNIVSTENHRYPTVSMQIVDCHLLKHHIGYAMYNTENNGFVHVCEGNRVEISFKFTYLHRELAIIRIPSIPSLQYSPTYISIIHIS